MSADDLINTCVACHQRLGDHSYRGAVITSVGMAQFRLCVPCRDGAGETLLRRLIVEAEQRLALSGPVGGHA